MKQKKLIKELNLSEKDFEEIKNKIAEIELKTSGEIAVAVAPESAHYSFWELLAANGIASILIIFLLPFANAISKLYEKLYWQNQPSWIMPAFFIVTFLASVVLIFYLCNIPFIDRLVIPGKVRRNCVTHRAFRYFTESGIYKTKENSGILIFVSYMEKQVRIIDDQGIASKISQDLWNLIADELAESLKNKKAKDGFINSISKCGELLIENFPPSEENPNEYPDGLVILEDEEWY